MGFLRRLIGLGEREPRRKPRPEDSWPGARILAGELDHPRGVAVDGDWVYITTGGFQGADNAVRRLPLAGGPADHVAPGRDIPSRHLVVVDEWVYWTNDFGGTLTRAPITGGSPDVLCDELHSPGALVLHGDNLYVLASGSYKYPTARDGELTAVPRTGGPGRVLSTTSSAHGLLALDGFVWFNTSRAVCRVPLDADGAGRIPGALATDGSRLYLTMGPGRSSLFSLALDGGEPRQLAKRAIGVDDIAVHGGFVYYFEEAGMIADALCRVPVDGGAVERLCGTGGTTGALAVGGGHVVWTDISTVRALPIGA